jgi:hypothetical protein
MLPQEMMCGSNKIHRMTIRKIGSQSILTPSFSADAMPQIHRSSVAMLIQDHRRHLTRIPRRRAVSAFRKQIVGRE